MTGILLNRYATAYKNAYKIIAKYMLYIIISNNKSINVAIKSPNGLTAREPLEKIVLQGDVFGPIECSVLVDTFGKECIKMKLGYHLFP